MKLSHLTATLSLPFLLCACHTSLDDTRFSTGSASLVASSDYSSVYVVEPDSGTLAIVGLDSESIQNVELGGEPTRVTRSGERVFVSLRTERQIAVLEQRGDGLTKVDEIQTGAEPFGLVASEDGERLYVCFVPLGGP